MPVPRYTYAKNTMQPPVWFIMIEREVVAETWTEADASRIVNALNKAIDAVDARNR